MYLLVISRETIDSLIGSNLNDLRSYGGDEKAETVNWWFCWPDLIGWRRDAVEIETPLKDDSKKLVVLGLEEREEAKVVAMVAIFYEIQLVSGR